MPRNRRRQTRFTEKGDGARLAGYNHADCSQRHRHRIFGRTQNYEFHVQMPPMPLERKTTKEIEATVARLTRTENHQNKKHLFYNTTYPVWRIHRIRLYTNI